MKTYSPTNFLGHRTIYFSQLLKTNLLSETTVSQAQPALMSEFSNINGRMKCEICSKLTIEANKNTNRLNESIIDIDCDFMINFCVVFLVKAHNGLVVKSLDS